MKKKKENVNVKKIETKPVAGRREKDARGYVAGMGSGGR
jgi:hypothetical protein